MNKLFWFLVLINTLCLQCMERKGSSKKKDQIVRLKARTIRRSSSDPGQPKGTDQKKRRSDNPFASISRDSPKASPKKSSKKISLGALLIKPEDLELSYDLDQDATLALLMNFMEKKGHPKKKEQSEDSPEEHKRSEKTASLEELLVKPEELEICYTHDPDATLAVLMNFIAEKGYLYHHLTEAHKNDPENTEAAVLRYCVDNNVTIEKLYNEHQNKKPAGARKALKILILHEMDLHTLLRLFAVHQAYRTKHVLPQFLNEYNHCDEVIAKVKEMQDQESAPKKRTKKKKKKKKKSGTQIHQFNSRRRIQRQHSQEPKTSTELPPPHPSPHAGLEFLES